MKRFNLAFRKNFDGILANDFLNKLGPDFRGKSDFIAVCISDYLTSQGITNIDNLTTEEARLIVKRKIRGDRELSGVLLSELINLRASQQASVNPIDPSTNKLLEEKNAIKETLKEENNLGTKTKESPVDLEDEDFDDIDENDADDDLLSMLDGF